MIASQNLTYRLDCTSLGTRVVFPVKAYTRATLQIVGTGSAWSTAAIAVRRGNNPEGDFAELSTAVSLTGTGFYPASGAYDVSAVSYLSVEVTAAQANFAVLVTCHADDSELQTATASTNQAITSIGCCFNGGTTTPALASVEVSCPFSGTITKWRSIGDAAGSAVVDVLKSTYANYGTVASIAASAKPTLSSVIKNQDSTLTGWTTAVTAGDVFRFTLESVTTCKRVSVSLEISRT